MIKVGPGRFLCEILPTLWSLTTWGQGSGRGTARECNKAFRKEKHKTKTWLNMVYANALFFKDLIGKSLFCYISSACIYLLYS